MRSDNRLAVIIFVALVVLVLTPVVYRQLRQVLGPRLLEVRIVTATDRDPTFRDGPRHVGAGERVQIAAALRVGRSGRGNVWLAPAEELELGGEPVRHHDTSAWPAKDRALRVFWFTVESSNVGGELGADDAGQRLHYRTFLAPEVGRGLRAAAFPMPHNEDQFGSTFQAPPGSGTIRLYARVEVFDPEREDVPLQASTTAGADHVLDPDFPAIFRSAELASGIEPIVGELFNLPGFEPVGSPSATADQVTVPAFGLTFTAMVARRLVTSSGTFAAVAVTGSPALSPPDLVDLGEVRLERGGLRRKGRALRWGPEVRPGDLLHEGSRWIVLVADNGDGVLDGQDRIAWCWRSPPTLATLAAALEPEVPLRLERHGG